VGRFRDRTFWLLSIAWSSPPAGMVSMAWLMLAICAASPCFMDVVSCTMPCVRNARSALHRASASSLPDTASVP
jgi:hypothetical protein